MRAVNLRSAAGVCLIALATAACSGDGDVGSSTVPTTVPTSSTQPSTVPTTAPATVVTTVPATVVTTAPATTQPAPATSAMTTAPVISSTPATLSPLNDTLLPTLETALPAALAAYSTALVDVARAPADLARRDALRGITGTTLYDRIEATLDGWVAEGKFQRERPGTPPRAEPRLFTAGMSADEPIAFMEACVVAPDFVIVAGPDGAETVTDDVVDSAIYSYVFEFTDDRWLITDFSVVEEFAGTEGCPS